MASTLHGRSTVGNGEQQVLQQLEATRTRLIHQYTAKAVSEADVQNTFARVAARFADARVRAFVPILVERGVRAELDH
jgi:hypothetical protein